MTLQEYLKANEGRGGMILNEYLHQRRMTQRDFAKALGVHDSAVSHWLAGTKRPSSRNIAAIQRYTGGAVTFNDWHGGEQ